MALTKTIEPDKIEVVGAHKHVQVRTATVIAEDGVEISRTFHRHVVSPGQDYSNEHPDVQAVCQAVHTPEVVEAYRATQAEE